MKTTIQTNPPPVSTPTIVEIPTDEVKFFVRRSRAPGAYSRLKQSIKEVGLHQPIHVRDIRQWFASDRKRPDGGLYSYELICGQGRLQAFRELEMPTIPAIIVDVPEQEIVGRFLAENVIRMPLSWHERAQMVKKDLENGLDIESIKRKYCITTSHAYKYLRILRQASAKVTDTELEKMSMNDAEALTALPKEEQDVIVEVLKEEQLGTEQLQAVVKKAREVKKQGHLSKVTLRDSIRKVDQDLKETRTMLKLKRLHWSLGPYHLKSILANPELRLALDKQQIDYQTYLNHNNKQEIA